MMVYSTMIRGWVWPTVNDYRSEVVVRAVHKWPNDFYRHIDIAIRYFDDVSYGMELARCAYGMFGPCSALSGDPKFVSIPALKRRMLFLRCERTVYGNFTALQHAD